MCRNGDQREQKATPSGVFDWTPSGQSGVWGNPNQRFRNIQKDILKTLLAYSIETPASPCTVSVLGKPYPRPPQGVLGAESSDKNAERTQTTLATLEIHGIMDEENDPGGPHHAGEQHSANRHLR